MNTERMHIVAQMLVCHVKRAFSIRNVDAVQFRNRRRELSNAIKQTEVRKDALPGRLDQQPRSQRARLAEPVEQRDPMTVAVEE